MYKEEYEDCTSLKARFHQYFIHGKSTDCTQWKRDYDNCVKYEENKDQKAGAQLIKSEEIRRQIRLQAHYGNDVWNKRSAPPKDWAKPLPEWLQKSYENTYLEIKSNEMKTGTVSDLSERTLCVIM